MIRLLLKLIKKWPKGTIEQSQALAISDVLYAPASFKLASKEELQETCNGCGPSGWKLDLVPDNIWLLYIGDACNIHDWMYSKGRTIEDKEGADRVFLNNLIRIIDRDKSRWRDKRKMKDKAYGYYLAVKKFGGPAFWRNKNAM